MSLTLGNFKQIIPSQILTRGREYLRRGQILDLTFDEEELVWEAQVEGTELYDVRVELKANSSLDCSCTCPYEFGEHCKHIAAVLYAIEENFPEQLGQKPRKRAARQTRHDKLRQRLEQASREQLVTILLDLTARDRELLNQLLIRLDAGDAKPTDYRRVVKDALRAGRGDYGYLDYTGSQRAARKIDELLEQVKRWLDSGELHKAISVCQAVIDEVTPAVGHADDSSGSLGGCISTAVMKLADAAGLANAAEREALFAYCLDRGRRQDFYEWDWGWELLDIAASMVKMPDQRARFVAALDDIQAEVIAKQQDAFFSRYKLERIALLKLALVEKFDGPTAARAFLNAHLHLDKLRLMAIERCLDEGALDEALRLIDAGIKTNQERRLPGLVNQYRELQVRLLQQRGDKTALIAAARTLWLERCDDNSFAVLKQTVPAAEWPAFVQGLIQAVQRRPQQLAWLYAQEGRWSDLLALTQSGPYSAELIETYRELLETRFPTEIAGVYEKIVDTILQRASGRSQYQQAVIYLRRIQKLGQAAQAETIVNRLKAQYPTRRALLDELSRL